MTGQIIRIISNLYTVKANGKKYECRARGKFKNDKLTPLVGDIVDFNENENYILNIHKRKNELIRPVIANVDKCIIVTSLIRPDFAPFLLDKMLTNVLLNDIEPIICFTKYDLLNDDKRREYDQIIKYYNEIGIPAILNTEIDKLIDLIKNKTVVLTGQTGVGKSTLLNKIAPELDLATNDISEALGRGKHTTRHVELFEVAGAYIADTPGFSALDIEETELSNIRFTFKEFKNDECKFKDCMHIHEKNCKVLEQLESGSILPSRYESYKKMVIK